MSAYKWPAFTYVNVHRKTLPQIHFVYLGNKETLCCILKSCCIISVLYSTKCHLFHNFILFFSDNTFFINHVLKFKYRSCHLKVCLCLPQIADALTDCRPVPAQPAYLYDISMMLTCPLPEEQNTRGRKIYPPEDSPQGFGILTLKQIPKVRKGKCILIHKFDTYS